MIQGQLDKIVNFNFGLNNRVYTLAQASEIFYNMSENAKIDEAGEKTIDGLKIMSNTLKALSEGKHFDDIDTYDGDKHSLGLDYYLSVKDYSENMNFRYGITDGDARSLRTYTSLVANAVFSEY